MQPSDRTPDDKYRDLLMELRSMPSAVLAFSGGLDSTFLLHAARQSLGNRVLAVTLAAPYTPGAELEEARSMASSLGVRHRVLQVPIPGEIRNNPADRCYLCKRELFSRLRDLASDEGIGHLLDGTNLDDLGDHRPGLKALGELGVDSPLLAAGLTKHDIRDLARRHGLAVWDKPAGACLLTRLPHGVRVEEAELGRIDQAEDFLKGLGFAAVRLRSHGDLARIEVPREWIAEVVEADGRHGIDARLKSLGYRHVAVDLAGYTMGNLNDKSA